MSYLKFEYVPLTFISSEDEIKKHIVNTIIFKYIYDNYKDTRKLGELLENTQYGFTASAQDSGNVRLLRISDIRNNQVDWEKVPYCDCDNKNYLLKKYDILVARTGGTTGKSFYVDEINDDSVFASYLIRLTANDKINPEYIMLFLNSYIYWNQISTLKSGSAQPNVNAEKLKTLSIPYCETYLQEKFISLSKNIDSELKEYQPLISKIKNALNSYNLVKEKNSLIEDNLKLIEDLRNSILNEAVHGKLVPQDLNDEPSSELLKKIQIEKEKLIKEGKIKKEKSLSTINDNDLPYKLPKSWEWAKLGSVANKITDGTHHSPINTDLGNYKYITAKNIKNDGINLNNITYVTKEIHKEIYSRCNPNYGDILYIKDGATTGIATINNLKEEFSMLSSVALIKLPNGLLNSFILYLMRSPLFYKGVRDDMSGVAITRVTLKKISEILIPIPPLNEQKRIVKKVDELVKLCNDLQENVISSIKENDDLLKSILHEHFNLL